MKEFANKLGASFWFGVLLLVCVAVGATAGIVGHHNGRQEALTEFTQCGNNTQVQDAVDTNDGHVCEHCRQCEGVIDRLKDKLEEARVQIAEARKDRLENKLEQLTEQLETQTAVQEQPPQPTVATSTWPAAPAPLPVTPATTKKPDERERGGLLPRFRRK